MRNRSRERTYVEPRPLGLGGHGELRQQRHARASGDHLSEGREARGTKLELSCVGVRTIRDRLVAKAVSVVEQEHPRLAKIRGREHEEQGLGWRSSFGAITSGLEELGRWTGDAAERAGLLTRRVVQDVAREGPSYQQQLANAGKKRVRAALERRVAGLLEQLGHA